MGLEVERWVFFTFVLLCDAEWTFLLALGFTSVVCRYHYFIKRVYILLPAEAAEQPSAPHVFLDRSSRTLDFLPKQNFPLTETIHWSFSGSRKVPLCNNKQPLLVALALQVKYSVYLVESWGRLKERIFFIYYYEYLSDLPLNRGFAKLLFSMTVSNKLLNAWEDCWPAVLAVKGIAIYLLRSVWVLLLSYRYHSCREEQYYRKWQFLIFIFDMCFDFFDSSFCFVPCLFYLIFFAHFMCTCCWIFSPSLIKGPEWTVYFVVVAHNMKGKMLVAQICCSILYLCQSMEHILGNGWSDSLLKWNMWSTMFKNYFFLTRNVEYFHFFSLKYVH